MSQEKQCDKNGGPCENTDREIYREPPGDYYAYSIHVTQGGGIGINVGGTVYVKPLVEWHRLAGGPFTPSHALPKPMAEQAVRKVLADYDYATPPHLRDSGVLADKIVAAIACAPSTIACSADAVETAESILRVHKDGGFVPTVRDVVQLAREVVRLKQALKT